MHVAVEWIVRICTTLGKCLLNQRSESTENPVKHDQKLKKYKDYHNKYFHKIEIKLMSSVFGNV